MLRKKITKIGLVFLLFICSCQTENEFQSASKMERLGRYASAIEKYKKFVEHSPQHALAPEALFRIAEIYRTVLNDSSPAKDYYFQVMNAYPKSSFWDVSRESYYNIPDYFPLKSGLTRLWGDSESRGKYMRTEEVLISKTSPDNLFKAQRIVFAGNNKVSEGELFYQKKDGQLREYELDQKTYCVLLKYPMEKGLSWEVQRNDQKWNYTIESVGLEVQVQAGVFKNCLKIKQQLEGSAYNYKYEYYAPEVGLILTSVGALKNETRIAELLKIDQTHFSKKTQSAVSAPSSMFNVFFKVRQWFASKRKH